MDQIKSVIDSLSTELIQRQMPDGKWNFCFESGIMSDAYMLLLMEVLEIKDIKLKQLLVDRILAQQTSTGVWKAFPDEKDGNPSATVEASIALLYTKSLSPDDSRLKRTREFLHDTGRYDQTNALTRTILAIFDHYPWTHLSELPVEFFLLPTWGPVHLFDFVGFARTHLAPIMLLQDRRLTITLPMHNQVQKWLPRTASHKRFSQQIKDEILALIPKKSVLDQLHHKALYRGERFLLDRMEPDGTLNNIMTTTFLMILALIALGYPKNHPIIQKAYNGLTTYLFQLPTGGHLQETNANVWDSALCLNALQKVGIHSSHPTVKKGVSYLLSRQQTRFGDWSFHNPNAYPGGWGFSDQNTIIPDIDDTTMCLRVLTPAFHENNVKTAWNRGTRWLLSMQNKDGGWPAFEKDTGKPWQTFLPDLGSKVWGDPSTADLTGRTLEFIGNYTSYSHHQSQINKAVDWLIKNQSSDGSWFGRWGVSYIYGTWAALTGLASVGVPHTNPTVAKGIKWLLSIQHKDGGWGESCYSDQLMSYMELPFSTPVQTAWALEALIAFYDVPTVEIQSGMKCLIGLLEKRSKEWTYPVGSGLAGQFYVYYHSYPYVCPLITLSHYLKKY